MIDRQVSSTAHPMSFYMVLSSDHIAPAIGKTVTVTLSKDGGAFGAAAGAVAEIGNGWYSLAGNATDRNTLGDLDLVATATACDQGGGRYGIVAQDPFATVVAANVTQILGTTSAGVAGYMGVDWSHVNAPTTTVGLTGTTISTSQVVSSVGSVSTTVNANIVQVNGGSAIADGTASAGSTTTITLAVGSSTVNSYYNDWRIQVVAGTGINQYAYVTAYNGGTLVATLDRTLSVAPDATSQYVIDPPSSANVREWLNVAPNALNSGNLQTDVQTIKTQTLTCAAPVTVLASVGTASTSTAQTGDNFTRIGAAGAGLTAVGLAGTQTFSNTGTWTGNVTGNVTGSVNSVTTAVSADVQTIKTQTITCAAPVTVLASVGTASTSTAQTGDNFVRIGLNGVGLTNVGLNATQTFSNTGDWTGNLSGSVGSIVGVTFPANFSATVISGAGAVNANVVDWLGLAPNALVGGNLPASVSLGSTAPTGWINAAAFAAGAINPAAVATGVYPMQVGPDFTNVKQATAPTTLTNITVPIVTSALNVPTALQNATAVWTDGLASDFNVLGSVGIRIMSGTSLLDSVIVEAGSPTLNARQSLCLILAGAAGAVAGAGTQTITINGAGTSTVRLTSNNPDSFGDRPNLVLNPPA